MKILYSQIKKYLPELKLTASEVGDRFTKIGYMVEKFIEVEYQGEKDFLMDLEVRQNRGDAFGLFGLVRELSASIGLRFKVPEINSINTKSEYEIPIQIETKNNEVKRLMAIKFKGLKIKDSPKWLKEYLEFYDIKSINNLVDLTNFITFETGIPSHVFDTDLTGDALQWKINEDSNTFTTLNGSELKLDNKILVIKNDNRVLSLSFIGGNVDSVSDKTTNVLLEMAIYMPSIVRRNSRQLNTITEAGSRLEKYIDPESVPYAFNMLVNLILENCEGEIDSKIYDKYIVKTESKIIEVNLEKVSQVAGILIPKEESISILTALGFEILSDNNSNITVKRPENRLDIEIEEDVFEEIIRIVGFDKVHKASQENGLKISVTKDITPKRIILIKKIEEILSNRGFDEVRSWVLVNSSKNIRSNYLSWDEIQVTNSINEEVPFLRQSILLSLIDQSEQFIKNNISDIKIFEIGKTYGKKDKSYKEYNSLGLLQKGNDIDKLKIEVEYLLRSIGLEEISYIKSRSIPNSAHPKTSWDFFFREEAIGIIYQSNKDTIGIGELLLAELNLDQVFKNISEESAPKEVMQKIVMLDSNIQLNKDTDLRTLIESMLNVSKKNIWKWEVLDQYEVSDTEIKYTIRTHYIDLSDQEAKELHKSIFK